MSAIPSQPDDPEYKDWSCSQNSMARQLVLFNSGDFSSDAAYYQFAHSMPKAVGPYLDHSFDNDFSYNSFPTKVSSALLRMTGIGSLASRLLDLSGIKFGLSVTWLSEYMNQAKYGNGLKFTPYLAEDFVQALEVIKQTLRVKGGVIAMVSFNLKKWHFISIIGVDDESVVILEINGKLYRWSLGQFDCSLNTGFVSDTWWPIVDEACRYAVSCLANWITPIASYNLLLITRN